MNVQWYPGHMTKARRQMEEDLRLIDLVIELVDARVPQSSRNPDIEEMGKNKSRLIILNKSDLADEKENKAWLNHFKEQGYYAVCADSRRSGDMKSIQNVIREACAAKKERDLKRGIKNRPVRAMVAGIPNVGKSTFINTYAGKASTKTGNKPGVTRGKQWIRLNKEVELLDTPGILWPKFEDPEVGARLAYTGAVKDDILDLETLSARLISLLWRDYPDAVKTRFKIEAEPDTPGPALLEQAGKRRGFLLPGGVIDVERTAKVLLEEYRSCRLGRFTLELPEETA